MRPLVRHDKELNRTWVLGARIHHGILGLALVLVGVYLMADDRHDFPWLSDA